MTGTRARVALYHHMSGIGYDVYEQDQYTPPELVLQKTSMAVLRLRCALRRFIGGPAEADGLYVGVRLDARRHGGLPWSLQRTSEQEHVQRCEKSASRLSAGEEAPFGA